METGKMINRISNRLRRRSMIIQTSIGVSGSQGMILDYIIVESVSHAVYQRDIEAEFGLRPSTATGALKELEEKGLIRRQPEPYDGRYKRIVFTDKAQMIKEKLRGEIDKSEEILLKGFTEEEKLTFLELADRMLANLDGAEDC